MVTVVHICGLHSHFENPFGSGCVVASLWDYLSRWYCGYIAIIEFSSHPTYFLRVLNLKLQCQLPSSVLATYDKAYSNNILTVEG